MGSRYEALYPYAPVWLQNLGISLYGLAYKHERLGGAFDAYVEQFVERESWDRTRMDRYLQDELSKVLGHAFAQVPHYERVWKAAGFTRESIAAIGPAELHRLPATSKRDLRAAPESFVARDIQAAKKLQTYATSGTSGTPIRCYCSADDHRRFRAGREARSFRWAGTSVRMPRSMIGGRRVVPDGVARPPYYRYNMAEKQVYFSAFHIAPGTMRDYVEGFERYRPEVLTGYAYSHFLLARMMQEAGVRLSYAPRALVLSSEKLTPVMKATILDAFGARAFEEYGSVEDCMLATECERGSLHVHPDFGIIEIVDDAGMPVPPGTEGRILCTSLLSETQPLIRYEIGDRGIWSADRCACGRDHLPVLQEIVGRLEDVITGKDGRQLVRFHWVYVDLPHIIEGQVIQEELDRFTLKLVVTPGFCAEDEEVIRRRFAERLGPVQLRFEQVPTIPRTERGKFRAVISRLPERNGGKVPSVVSKDVSHHV